MYDADDPLCVEVENVKYFGEAGSGGSVVLCVDDDIGLIYEDALRNIKQITPIKNKNIADFENNLDAVVVLTGALPVGAERGERARLHDRCSVNV